MSGWERDDLNTFPRELIAVGEVFIDLSCNCVNCFLVSDSNVPDDLYQKLWNN